MQIAIGSDHGGFKLKQEITKWLDDFGHSYKDYGTIDESSVDYPDYAAEVAKAVGSGEADFGILVCGTGIGMAITANKIPGVRAANVTDTYSAQMLREHNDGNVLCLGARVTGYGLAQAIVDTFLNTSFAGGRHQRRVSKISALEE